MPERAKPYVVINDMSINLAKIRSNAINTGLGFGFPPAMEGYWCVTEHCIKKIKFRDVFKAVSITLDQKSTLGLYEGNLLFLSCGNSYR